METLEAIMTRRSVRKWKPEAVPEALRKKLLEAAMNAPSAADARPWQFVVMDDPETIGKFTEMGGTEMLAGAPLLVLVCGEPAREVYPGFWPQDCSCAAQNLQLAAHDLGLGCVWIAVYPLEDRVRLFREVLGIPEEVVPFALLAVGFPDEHPEPEYRYDPDRVHYGKW